MKLTPRPITVSDEIDKSRDVSGFNKWARSSRTISFIMLLLGWFTIPAEVLLRRNFGQRWFTVVNFYAGLLLLLIFSVVQYLFNVAWNAVQDFITQVKTAFDPHYVPPEPAFTDQVMDNSMFFFLTIYLLMGCFHLAKIWWRNRTNNALHSFDDGTSRLERLAGLVIWPLNLLAAPFVYLYRLILPKKLRAFRPLPKLVNDRTAFTNTILEPFLLLLFAVWLHGVASLWLFLSTIAVAIHANWKETARQSKILDFRDSMMEAKAMRELKEGAEQPDIQSSIVQRAKEANKNYSRAIPPAVQPYPNLMTIIEELNRDGSHLAN